MLLCNLVSQRKQHTLLLLFSCHVHMHTRLFFSRRVYMIYVKLALVLVYAFGRSNLDDQAVMFWGIITFWSLWSCTHLPYRCRSSNR